MVRPLDSWRALSVCWRVTNVVGNCRCWHYCRDCCCRYCCCCCCLWWRWRYCASDACEVGSDVDAVVEGDGVMVMLLMMMLVVGFGDVAELVRALLRMFASGLLLPAMRMLWIRVCCLHRPLLSRNLGDGEHGISCAAYTLRPSASLYRTMVAPGARASKLAYLLRFDAS